MGVVLLVSMGWWLAGARTWFTGPRRTLDSDEEEGSSADASEQDLAAVLDGKDPSTVRTAQTKALAALAAGGGHDNKAAGKGSKGAMDSIGGADNHL